MKRVVLAFAAFLLVSSFGARAQAQTRRPGPTEAQKDEARNHFELGLSHFDREEWPAALVEFLKSRELFPTRGNTKDSAICLRKVGRFGEALDMYQTLLHDFPDLTVSDRALAQREIAELQASVGAVTLEGAPDDASVTIDGIDHGRTPLKTLRLSAGTHTLRVTKEGSLPFERRFDLTGRQAAVVHVALALLTQAGRLHVVEHAGKSLQIVVDGAVVGTTPWEGALAPGAHTVLLEGEGNVGTPPRSVNVAVDQVAALDLVSEVLGAALHVDLKPSAAAVTIDGVPVGRGPWDGRLAPGSHKIEATLEGYALFTHEASIADGAKEVVAASLEPLAVVGGRNGLSLEVDLGAALGLYGNYDLTSASVCGACTSSLPLGAEGVVHVTYQFTFGLGLGLHVGYTLLGSSIDGRAAQITSGKYVATGTAHDGILFNGLLAGLDVQYRTAGSWPLTLRLGLGALVGSARDHRAGNFAAGKDGTPTPPVDTTQSPTAAYLDVAPEVRVGRRFGDHFELNVGIAAHVLANVAALPRWDNMQAVKSGSDGVGVFPNQSLAGPVLFVLVPGIGFRYDF